MKQFIRTIFLGALVAFLAACYPELDWREFSWPQGRFTVLFPSRPAEATRDITLAGASTRMQMLSARIEGMAFGVGYADLPAGVTPAAALTDGRDALVRNIGGTITTERDVAIEGAAGRELFAEGRSGEQPMVLAARLFIAGNRYYQVVFIGRKDRAQEVDTSLYLGSFKLLSR